MRKEHASEVERIIAEYERKLKELEDQKNQAFDSMKGYMESKIRDLEE